MIRSVAVAVRAIGMAASLVVGAAAAAAQGSPGSDGPARPAVETTSLRLLGADPRQMRFEGEIDSRIFPVFLTGGQANAQARIRLAYTNAVSVMPEASHMKISINDVLVGDIAIASPSSSDPPVLDLDIPAGLLEPGFNAFKVEVQQRHRVDCSLGATYELWTQLDPTRTGLAFSDLPTETITDVADLPALAADPTGSTPLRIVVPKGMEAASLDRVLHAVQVVAIRGRFGHPVVEVVGAPVEAPGLDLMVGTSDELKRAGLTDYLSDDQPVQLRTGATPGHTVFVLSGLGTAEVDAGIALLLKGAAEPPPGTVAGLRALILSGGTPVEGGKSLTLRDLGVSSQEFSGRMFRTGFDMLMPPDFYAADYGKITLRIDAGYVGGLDPSSQILVRVNDRDAASLALPNPRGDVFLHRPITVSLADLRPGFNHVQIEAQLSAPLDKACEPATLIDGKKRFVLLEDSGLELPSVARVAHLPSLAVTAASGFPYLAAAGDSVLFLPHPDAESIGAAATFLTRAALSAGAPLATRLVLTKPDLDKTSALVIGALNDVPASMADAAGLNVSATREAWSHIEAKVAAYARLNEAHGNQAPAFKGKGVPAPLAGNENSSLFRKWSETVSSGHLQIDPYGLVSNLLRRAVGLSGASLTPWSRIETKYVPDVRSRLVVAQHAAPGGNGATWTLVVAPSAELLQDGMRELTSTWTWSQLDGRIASLDPKARVLSEVPSTQGYFLRTATLSPGNLRLIAAGWLSSYLEYYVLSLVALSLGLGLATTAVVRRYGVQP